MGAILILVFSGLWGSLNLFFSIGLLVLYGIFIIFVVIEDKKETEHHILLYEQNLEELSENLLNKSN